MNSPTYTPQVTAPRTNETVEVPAKWRAGQIAVIALLIIGALYYFLMGWRSPSGDTGTADNRSIFDLIGFVLVGALVWLTTPAAGTIATTTFHEAIRRKWITALLGFAVVILLLSTLFTWMPPDSQEKFIRDFGVGFIVIMTLLVAIFLGVSLVPPEIERRTIFTILSKPVTRLEFLIGKYLGLMMTLLLNLFIMSALFLLAFAWFKIRHHGWANAWNPGIAGVGYQGLGFDLSNLTRSLSLQIGTLSIMAGVAMTLSLVAANIMATILSFLVYFAGQVGAYLTYLAGSSSGGTKPSLAPGVRMAVDGLYFFLPRLDTFEVRERLVNELPIGLNYLFKAFNSGAIYTGFLLVVAYLLFSDREF